MRKKGVLILLIIIPLISAGSCASVPGGGSAAEDTVQEKTAPVIPSSGVGPEISSFQEETAVSDIVSGNAAHPDVIPDYEEKVSTLSDQELADAAEAELPWNMIAVTESGKPLMLVHDIDKDGYNDAVLLAVEGDRGTDAGITALSDYSRLFRGRDEYCSYFVLVFYQKNGQMKLRYTIPVSEQAVFAGLQRTDIRKGHDFPYCIEVSFRTRAGSERVWIILNGYGISRLTIKENLSVRTICDDIDGDGYIDVVTHEQGFEEGTGSETFLTWYRWNLREYEEYAHTNIVRNLRFFLAEASSLLRDGNFKAFLERTVDPGVLSELRREGVSDAAVLERVFSSAEGSVPAGFFERGGFSAVVFPDFTETPFSKSRKEGFIHDVPVRFVYPGEPARIFTVRLVMNRNPFSGSQYGFSVQ